MAKKFEFKGECRRCRGNGHATNRKTQAWEVCTACNGKGETFRKISYAGPVGLAMLAQERYELAYILAENKGGRLGGTMQFKAQERLEQKGKIVFVKPVRALVGGWMVAGWRKPLDRSYCFHGYGGYGGSSAKLWSPVTGKLVRRKKSG